MSKIYTLGQVAKICKVSRQTLKEFFDLGELRGYIIPGSEEARIPNEELIRFMKDYGIPLGKLEEGERI